MWVVKLGGSLAACTVLRDWLAVLAQHGQGRAVVVPGGGPFADAVRSAQVRWRFGDDTAHTMALLAMQQYGWMLTGLEPALRIAPGAAAVQRALGERQSAVWLPDLAELDAAGVTASWDVTSDSLALWLASRLGASDLLLVKSAAIPSGQAKAADLVEAGILDRAFPSFCEGFAGSVWLAASGDSQQLVHGLLALGCRGFCRLVR